jgi:FixJ family two-component response regulator
MTTDASRLVAPAPAAPPCRISIVIIDDEAAVRVGLRRLCQALGLAATVYASGREFLESIDAGLPLPDCLLLDAQMPEMTGLDLQRQLCRRAIRIPTIVFTADDAPETRSRYLAAGAFEYFRKPIAGDDLLAAVRRAATPAVADGGRAAI